MNTDTGKIYSPEDMAALDKMMKDEPPYNFNFLNYHNQKAPNPTKLAEEILKADQENKIIEMKVPPTPGQLARGRVGRNDPCPCGSGKKFKKCHWTGRKI